MAGAVSYIMAIRILAIGGGSIIHPPGCDIRSSQGIDIVLSRTFRTASRSQASDLAGKRRQQRVFHYYPRQYYRPGVCYCKVISDAITGIGIARGRNNRHVQHCAFFQGHAGCAWRYRGV